MANRKTIIHYRTKDGSKPTDLEYGELAIAYGKDKEKIFLKNDNNKVVEFNPIDPSEYTKTVELPIKKGAANNSAIIGNLNTNEASGDFSFAQGRGTHATKDSAHAEGVQTHADGDYSHAEGVFSTASGNSSHAEGGSINNPGLITIASGTASHAEGIGTTASGSSAHSEGRETKALGNNSHTEGYGTEAKNDSEHASGIWNISNKENDDFGNSDNTLFSIGNGTRIGGITSGDIHRHNAFEVKQDGTIFIADTSSDGEYYEKDMIALQDALKIQDSSIDTQHIKDNAITSAKIAPKTIKIDNLSAIARPCPLIGEDRYYVIRQEGVIFEWDKILSTNVISKVRITSNVSEQFIELDKVSGIEAPSQFVLIFENENSNPVKLVFANSSIGDYAGFVGSYLIAPKSSCSITFNAVRSVTNNSIQYLYISSIAPSAYNFHSTYMGSYLKKTLSIPGGSSSLSVNLEDLLMGNGEVCTLSLNSSIPSVMSESTLIIDARLSRNSMKAYLPSQILLPIEIADNSSTINISCTLSSQSKVVGSFGKGTSVKLHFWLRKSNDDRGDVTAYELIQVYKD